MRFRILVSAVTLLAVACGDGEGPADGFDFEEEPYVCDPLPSIAPPELRRCVEEEKIRYSRDLVKLAGCQHAVATIGFGRTSVDFAPLSELVYFEGRMSFGRNTFENVDALNRVERVSELFFGDERAYPGFTRLREVDHKLGLGTLDGAEISSLRSLRRVGGLTVSSGVLPDLDKLACLEKIDGDVEVGRGVLDGGEAKVELRRLMERVEITGGFVVMGEEWDPAQD